MVKGNSIFAPGLCLIIRLRDNWIEKLQIEVENTIGAIAICEKKESTGESNMTRQSQELGGCMQSATSPERRAQPAREANTESR